MKIFSPKPRKKVLFSNDFRDAIISQDTSIIEQRIIMMILSSLKDEQSLFINVKPITTDPQEVQLSFDDYYDGWANQGEVEFLIPLKTLKDGQRMNNLAIKSALVNMTNINWLTLRDDAINGFRAVSFIKNPKWNKDAIFFNMDKAVLQHLLNVSHFFTVKKDLPYKVSSSNTLKFLLWLLKFEKNGFVKKSYTDLLKELYLSSNKYENRSKFERDFLKPIKADLDSMNEVSFNYSVQMQVYTFLIYYTRNSIGLDEKFATIEQLQIHRALKYLCKRRNLSDSNVNVLLKLYEVRGYEEFSQKIKRKIRADLYGDDYIKEIFTMLEK